MSTAVVPKIQSTSVVKRWRSRFPASSPTSWADSQTVAYGLRAVSAAHAKVAIKKFGDSFQKIFHSRRA